MANLEADHLSDLMTNVLQELGGRLETEISGRDECAVDTAVKKAMLRAHDLGIVSGAEQANARARERGLELNFNPVVGGSADVPDEWLERFGDDE